PVLARNHSGGNSHQGRARELPAVRARINEASNLALKADEALKQHDYAKAESLYKKAESLHGNDMFLKFARSQVYSEQGRMKEAFETYREGIHPAPSEFQRFGYTDTLYFSRYAELAHAVGSQEEAEWAARQIVLTTWQAHSNFPKFTEKDLDSVPVDDLATLAVGLAQSRNGENKKALATFQRVAKQNPRLALAHLYIGEEYEKIVGPGYTPAREAYAKAVKLDDPVVRTEARKHLKSLERPAAPAEAILQKPE
ncbi:MAG: tetratricopeptide repeat protein, partial [Proteobacteria bacterium]